MTWFLTLAIGALDNQQNERYHGPHDRAASQFGINMERFTGPIPMSQVQMPTSTEMNRPGKARRPDGAYDLLTSEDSESHAHPSISALSPWLILITLLIVHGSLITY